MTTSNTNEPRTDEYPHRFIELRKSIETISIACWYEDAMTATEYQEKLFTLLTEYLEGKKE